MARVVLAAAAACGALCQGWELRGNGTLPSVAGGGVAAVVLSFNHRENVNRIAAALKRERGIAEIVVAEDGSTDGSKEAWSRALRGGRDSIAHTADLHEIRAYNNAFRSVRNASVACFLQDDDIPDDAGWASQVLELMEAFRAERLGILSGLATEVCQLEFGEQQVDHPAAMKNMKRTRPIPYLYDGRVPFMFATEAWLSPLCARVDVFRALGGFDETLARPGEPGIGLDIHLSLRAALRGITVGVHGAKFRRGVGGHGTVANPNKAKLRLCKRHQISARIRQVAGCRWPPSMLDHAKRLNQRHLVLRHPGLVTEMDTKCRAFTSHACRYAPPRHFPEVCAGIVPTPS